MLLSGFLAKLLLVLDIVITTVCANSFVFIKKDTILVLPFLVLLVAANLLTLFSKAKFPDKRTHICNHGVKCLTVFLFSVTFSIAFHIYLAFRLFPDNWLIWVFSALLCIFVESVIFWNGIISVYSSSVQLGIKERVLGIVFGLVPIAHLVMLIRIIRISGGECSFETKKHMLDLERKDKKICATKYPVLLVHGVFFRDVNFMNYWGRIPKALEKNGAVIYYGEHESAASVQNSAAELENRIRNIIETSGCEKLNIIAHSKGGLDCRYMLCNSDTAKYVASLTTINTPHRGCLFADYLLNKIPDGTLKGVAGTYNATMRRLGDKNPDFVSAVYDLTSERCLALESEEQVYPDSVFTRSVGSKLNNALGGKFPLNFSYLLAKQFDGPNDGLVGENSFRFGENYTFLTVNGKRGISHGDMIDLNRENIAGFDVREFYVKLLSDLKEMGL